MYTFFLVKDRSKKVIVGVPREIKVGEFRVGLTPATTHRLVKSEHLVLIEKGAGAGIGASDQDYADVGAEIISNSAEVFARSEMVVKVKEPQEPEWQMLKKDQILFTYLHLAADPKQAKGLLDSHCHAIAYETVTDNNGGLPLLAPMSEIAGRLAVIEGAYHSKKNMGGIGRLISGVPGVKPAKVTIIGGGMVGKNAAQMAVGLGADVTIFEKSVDRLRLLSDFFGGSAKVLYSEEIQLSSNLRDSDLVIGAVLIPGAKAPRLIKRQFLSQMKKNAILVDVAIDQGGCFETSKATTHDNPTYIEENIVHYCVANMPGSVPKTASDALNNVTGDYIIKLANKGMAALKEDTNLFNGLNISNGSVANNTVRTALGDTI